MSRCCGVPSSSTVDVSRVQGKPWMFAKLSLLPGSKSVWAEGETKESTANPAPAGSATFFTHSVLNQADYFEPLKSISEEKKNLMEDEPWMNLKHISPLVQNERVLFRINEFSLIQPIITLSCSAFNVVLEMTLPS